MDGPIKLSGLEVQPFIFEPCYGAAVQLAAGDFSTTTK